jgi:hypothetical protein
MQESEVVMKFPRNLIALAVTTALGLGGVSAVAQEHPRHHPPAPEDDVEVEVEVDEEEPRILPPQVVPPRMERERPLGLNPMVSAEPVGRLAADLNLYLGEVADDANAFIFSPVLQARIPVGGFELYGSGFELGLDVPLLWIAPWSDPGNQIRGAIGIGNPLLSSHFVQAIEDVTYSVGLGVAVPFASDRGERGPARGVGYENAIANRAGHEMWLWSPERLSIVVPARFEALVDRFVLGMDAAFGAMIYVGPGQQDTDYVTQIGAEFGYQVTPVSTLGLRALGHWAPTLPEYDFAFALEPGFRAEFGNESFLGVRLTMPLTSPYGFAFERGGNYALSFTIGRQL